ncbi:BING4CT-domain-containing protein [Polyplosphaeria fusca]|uniref:U three protein 7 n=1 Tax=Polyplosphaeria fusca TaxID=682080 RepID=A0A9P4R6V7_9PLEO|nr:BING4CT-domain-containing protein [Polyplosphaeria fusca]
MSSDKPTKPAKARRKSASASNHINDAEAKALAHHVEAAKTTYGRGQQIRTKSVKDKKLRANLKVLESKNKESALQAKNAEILLDNSAGLLEPEHELERTYKVRQDEIRQDVGIETAKKAFELRLGDLGPYQFDFTRNGRDLLLGGLKGHVASFDWRQGKLGCELNLNETVRDIAYLHSSQMFAVAQKKNVYVYAGDGVELHNLKKHVEATHLQFLPYHFLLASVSSTGVLRYTDVSTGAMIYEQSTKLGPPTAFCQNPRNAILHVGHQKGTVTLWSPNSSTPLAKLLTNSGPVRAMSIDRSGRYFVAGGQDRKVSIWDIRNFKELRSFHLRQPASTVSISDRNLTAVGWGTQISIYNSDIFSHTPSDDVKIPAPYMAWGGEGNTISRVKFCPFEDVLGISHSRGYSSILVPGSGEPNPDSLESGTNPFETTRQRQEAEVHALLEKLQPEMISLDPNFIGNLDLASEEQRRKERDLDSKKEDRIERLKKKGRGRNSALKKYLRKSGQRNVIDEEKVRAREALSRMDKREVAKVQKLRREYGPALERFASKSG